MDGSSISREATRRCVIQFCPAQRHRGILKQRKVQEMIEMEMGKHDVGDVRRI